MKKGLILAFALAAGAFGAYEISREAESMKAGEVPPAWLEPDSVTAIQNRLKADFSLTRAELLARIREQHRRQESVMWIRYSNTCGAIIRRA